MGGKKWEESDHKRQMERSTGGYCPGERIHLVDDNGGVLRKEEVGLSEEWEEKKNEKKKRPHERH